MDIDTTRRAFDEKVRAGIFNPIARHLHAEIREDRLAEGIAFAWRLYRTRDGDVDTALLVHHARLRACDVSCNIAGGYRKNDVLTARNTIGGNVEVLHVDGDDVGLARELSRDPSRKILSAISLKSWLDGLPEDDRRMLELRMSGCGLDEMAAIFGINTSNVCRRLYRLGLELAEKAGIEIRTKNNKRDTTASARAAKYPLVAHVA